jgi:hypothetical protein
MRIERDGEDHAWSHCKDLAFIPREIPTIDGLSGETWAGKVPRSTPTKGFGDLHVLWSDWFVTFHIYQTILLNILSFQHFVLNILPPFAWVLYNLHLPLKRLVYHFSLPFCFSFFFQLPCYNRTNMNNITSFS